MKSNLAVLRKSSGLTKENQIAHIARLSAVIDSKAETLPENLVKLAENSGLIWSVSIEQMKKYFNYHANVRGFAIRSFTEIPIQYNGDIPDFALERAELGINLGMKYITLHSIMPVIVDPVMVGWFNFPLKMGFVLAIWQNGKEVKL